MRMILAGGGGGGGFKPFTYLTQYVSQCPEGLAQNVKDICFPDRTLNCQGHLAKSNVVYYKSPTINHYFSLDDSAQLLKYMLIPEYNTFGGCSLWCC